MITHRLVEVDLEPLELKKGKFTYEINVTIPGTAIYFNIQVHSIYRLLK